MNSSVHDSHTTGRYALGLFVLSALFMFRVAAQLLVSVIDVSFLPAFESWHSGTMPYPILVLFQVLILTVMMVTAIRCKQGNISANRRTGAVLLIFGIFYLFSMLLRFALGLWVFTDSRWFTNYLPTLFHIVLAVYVLLIGHYHYRYSDTQTLDGEKSFVRETSA